jgi:beta-aspartyl-peptidase (threonine type)
LLHSSITEAADNALREVAAIGGDGGLIVLDAKGNHAMRFNTRGMFRGTIGSDGIAWVRMFE